MPALPKSKLTVAEYLAIERKADFKSEFFDGQMYAMAGANRHHNIVMVSQHEPMCERFTRSADGSWALVAFVGLDAKLELTSVPVQVPLADIYAGITFPGPDTERE